MYEGEGRREAAPHHQGQSPHKHRDNVSVRLQPCGAEEHVLGEQSGHAAAVHQEGHAQGHVQGSDQLHVLHFTNGADSFWKVRLLFEEINSTAKNLVQQSEYVSVDETMVRYFGRHPLKQAIREKPER